MSTQPDTVLVPEHDAAGSGSGSADEARPEVSLCIPAFQAERHLRATIHSVLAQSFADLEILILDNNSTDGTRAILQNVHDDRVRVMRNATTLPMADSWNLAVRKSRGRFVKIVCADDTLEPDCVAAQVELLQSDPDVALVAARTDFIDDVGKRLRPARGLRGIGGRRSGQHVVRRIVRSGSNPVGAPVAVMFRRSDFDRCGGFRGELSFAMDVDLWVRLMRCGDFIGIPRTLASFRFGSDSTTALTSARSQLAQQIEFARRLVGDPFWGIPRVDRLLGRVNSYDMQARRSLLFAISSLRAWRRQLADSG